MRQGFPVVLATRQRLVGMCKLWSVLEPPLRSTGQKPSAGGCKRFTALISPTASITVEHRPIVAHLGLTAGSETHSANVKDLMLLSHNIPPLANVPITLLPNIQPWNHQCLLMIQQAEG
jgi:hypothetical protein